MAYSDSQLESSAERLFVLNGELRGVSVPLGKGTFRVGSSNDCDVILLSNENDESEVSFTSSDDEELFLTDPVGDIRVGRKALNSGKRLIVKSGIPVMIGETKVMVAESIDAADRAEQFRLRRFKQIAWVASLVFVVGIATIYGSFGNRGVVVAKTISAAEQSSVQSNAVDFVAAANATQNELNSGNLSHISAFADNAVGTIKVRGRLRESEKARWREVSTWFDAMYGGSIMLDVELDTVGDALTLPFAVSAVWMGETSHLTLHDGSQRYTGELLPGGWTLEKISSDRITISKSGESLVVPL